MFVEQEDPAGVYAGDLVDAIGKEKPAVVHRNLCVRGGNEFAIQIYVHVRPPNPFVQWS